MRFTDADGQQLSSAQQKAKRRKASNKAKREGGIEVLTGAFTSKIQAPELNKLQRAAESQMGKRIKMSGATTPEGRKARRKLNDVWLNRKDKWTPEGVAEAGVMTKAQMREFLKTV